VAIPDFLRQDLLERGGHDLSVIRLKLVIAREVDLYAALHGGARHFIDISLEAFQEIQREYHRERRILVFVPLIKGGM
jgi:hypothetical protein